MGLDSLGVPPCKSSWMAPFLPAPGLVVIVLSILTVADGKLCVKRDEIGDREGNQYYCDDPALTECCESDHDFLCCQPRWKSSLPDIIWILFAVLAVAILMWVLGSCCTGQSVFFRSPTVQDAAVNWRNKIIHKFQPVGDQRDGMDTGKAGTTVSEMSYSDMCTSHARCGKDNKAYIGSETC